MKLKIIFGLLVTLLITSSLVFAEDLNKYTVEFNHYVVNKSEVIKDVTVELMSFSKDPSPYYRLLSETTNDGTNLYKEYSAFTYTFKGLEPGKLGTLKKYYDVNLYPMTYKIDSAKVTSNLGGNENYLNPEKYIVSDDPLVIETAKKIVGNVKNPYEKAKLLYAYVASKMVYKLDSPISSSGSYSAIRDILRSERLTEETKKGLVYNNTTDDYDLEEFSKQEGGLCFDYSTLLVALMRSQGIPSRVAVGYVVTEDNVAELKKNGETNITENPHAWVEVYLAPYGWIHVDPTISGLNFNEAKETFAVGGQMYLKQGYNFPYIKYKASSSAAYSSKVLLQDYIEYKDFSDEQTDENPSKPGSSQSQDEAPSPEQITSFDRKSLIENMLRKKSSLSKYYDTVQSELDTEGAIDYVDSRITDNSPMSRAKAFALIYLVTEQFGPFSKKEWKDLEGHWIKNPIESLSTSKIANGYADGTMKPDKFISEQESAMIMNNRFGLDLYAFSNRIKDFIMGIRTYIFN